jgi:hypothetical protein
VISFDYVNQKMSLTAKIAMLSGPSYTVQFDPNERIISFNQRVANTVTSGVYKADTSRYRLLYKGKPLNTVANRNTLIREIVKEENPVFCASDWTLGCGAGSIYYRGNLSEIGADRSTCGICLEEINDIHSGSPDNPLIPRVLHCGHAFHQGCFVGTLDRCPTCRAELTVDDRLLMGHIPIEVYLSM